MTITRIKVTTYYISLVSVMRSKTRKTYGCGEECKERGVVASADAVVHPLTVVITSIHAIIALNVSSVS